VESLAKKKVVGISCGQASIIVIMEYGKMYGFDLNNVGQLGTNDYNTTSTIQQVDSLKGTMINNSCLDKAKEDC